MMFDISSVSLVCHENLEIMHLVDSVNVIMNATHTNK